MTKKTRRRFAPEYKEQAVARLSEPGVTYASLSAELGITSGQLKAWHLELLVAGSATAIAQTKAEAAELAQLRRDVKRLKEENEVMRKASIFLLSGRRRHEHQAHVHCSPCPRSRHSLAVPGFGCFPKLVPCMAAHCS